MPSNPQNICAYQDCQQIHIAAKPFFDLDELLDAHFLGDASDSAGPRSVGVPEAVVGRVVKGPDHVDHHVRVLHALQHKTGYVS